MATTGSRTLAAALLATLALGACGGSTEYIPGTKVPRSQENQGLIDRIEDYRMAVERKDAAALVLMASKRYWEDAGTPTGTDDYGYQGLQQILTGRFQRVKAIRYSMRYMNVRRTGDRAYVDVLVDASFTVEDARGEDARADMRDQNQFTLEWDGRAWLFLSGM
jgi:ketosteroid isomerase-like protein